jgi:hypothetical protein
MPASEQKRFWITSALKNPLYVPHSLLNLRALQNHFRLAEFIQREPLRLSASVPTSALSHVCQTTARFLCERAESREFLPESKACNTIMESADDERRLQSTRKRRAWRHEGGTYLYKCGSLQSLHILLSTAESCAREIDDGFMRPRLRLDVWSVSVNGLEDTFCSMRLTSSSPRLSHVADCPVLAKPIGMCGTCHTDGAKAPSL